MEKSAILFVLVILFANPVFAQSKAGITPDSILYGLDTTFDRLSLMFTFGPSEKAIKGLEIARERLIEMSEMAGRKDADAVRKAQTEHKWVILEVEKSMSKIEGDSAEETLESQLMMQSKIQKHLGTAEVLTKEAILKVSSDISMTIEEKEEIITLLSAAKEAAADTSELAAKEASETIINSEISQSKLDEIVNKYSVDRTVSETRFCITLYDPVCGTDGVTYSNECFANTAGVKVEYEGECVFTINEAIVVDNQELSGVVKIEQVNSSQRGWVVIYSEDGEIIGRAAVQKGVNNGVSVSILGNKTGTFSAALHIDAGEEGVFEFPEKDVKVESVSDSFIITPSVAQKETQTETKNTSSEYNSLDDFFAAYVDAIS